jgi:hypothetical protein
MRKPGLDVREGRVRKSRSVEGKGLVRVSDWSGGAADGVCVVGSINLGLVFAFQKSLNSLFRISNRVRQFDLGKIMRVQALDVTLVSTGNRLLRLDDL